MPAVDLDLAIEFGELSLRRAEKLMNRKSDRRMRSIELKPVMAATAATIRNLMRSLLPCLSPRMRAFSRAACARAAISRTNSQARRPGRLWHFFVRRLPDARRQYAPAQFQNARSRADLDRSYRDNQRRAVKAQTTPARDDRARYKSQLARRSKRRLECGDNFCGCRGTGF